MNGKKFAGIIYKFSGSYPSKGHATDAAKRKRKQGYKARVVREYGGYGVYYR